MTGLPHFAAKIKFVQCPKKLASCNARERQREEREREKKIIILIWNRIFKKKRKILAIGYQYA